MASVIAASTLEALLQKSQTSFHLAESLPRSVRGEDLDEGRICSLQNIPWPEVYASGEFNVCRGWMDIDMQALRFQREIKLIGEVYVFAGEYVGPAVHMVAALQRTRGPPPPACTMDLMSRHTQDKSSAEMSGELGAKMEMTDISARCDALGYESSTDQEQLFQTLLRKHIHRESAFIPVGASPRASKTFTGSIYASAYAAHLQKFEAMANTQP